MRVPIFKDPEVTKFLLEFNLEHEREKKNVLVANGGNRSLLLYSPSKKVYEVTVNDAGVLAVTKVSDG